MTSKVVLDGGGHFNPAGIVRVHTLSLLLSSQPAHDRAEVDSHVQDKRQTRRNTERGYSTSLDREVLTPSPCE